MTLDGRPARRVEVWPDRVADGGPPRPLAAPLDLEDLLRDLAEGLADVDFRGRFEPYGDVRVRFTGGVVVDIGTGTAMTVEGATRGPAHALRVASPVHLRFDGEGILVSHSWLPRLTRLAQLRVVAARIDPDGALTLEGGAARGLDRAARGGLRLASTRITELLRHSPRYARVRAFLTVGPPATDATAPRATPS